MSRDEQERLRDIKDAISAIHDHLAKAGDSSRQGRSTTPRRPPLSVRGHRRGRKEPLSGGARIGP